MNELSHNPMPMAIVMNPHADYTKLTFDNNDPVCFPKILVMFILWNMEEAKYEIPSLAKLPKKQRAPKSIIKWAGITILSLLAFVMIVVFFVKSPSPQSKAITIPTIEATTTEPIPETTAEVEAKAILAAEKAARETQLDISILSPGDANQLPKDSQILTMLDNLEVKGKAPKTGYDRSEFGQRWADVDRNGCDTRNDILKRDLTNVIFKPSTKNCVVASGHLNDKYTGQYIDFVRGPRSSEVQIDHIVALYNAWQTGAQLMSYENRVTFANDPLNLIAVQGIANTQKGGGDAATWLPPNISYRCEYVTRQIQVKTRYHLWVTQPEKDTMIRVLGSCGIKHSSSDPVKPENKSTANHKPPAPVNKTNPIQPSQAKPQPKPQPRPQPKPAPKPQPKPSPQRKPKPAPQPTPRKTHYKNCSEVRKAGAAPIHIGEPGYSPNLDGDHDGIACEWKKKKK